MTLRFVIFFLVFIPPGLLAQTKTDSVKNTKEIYAIIQSVIKKEKLDKKYGLKLSPALNCSCMENDTAYLPKLLINPEKTDTSCLLRSTVIDTAIFTMPNGTDTLFLSIPVYYPVPCAINPGQNIFTQEEIDYILDTNNRSKIFTWNNVLLGFNLKNKKNFYVFSIPRFNPAHDKAIVMCEFLCPGLCGNGSTLLLSKTEKGWDVSTLQSWYH